MTIDVQFLITFQIKRETKRGDERKEETNSVFLLVFLFLLFLLLLLFFLFLLVLLFLLGLLLDLFLFLTVLLLLVFALALLLHWLLGLLVGLFRRGFLLDLDGGFVIVHGRVGRGAVRSRWQEERRRDQQTGPNEIKRDQERGQERRT